MSLAISELNKRSSPFSAAPGAERKSSSSTNSTLSPRDKCVNIKNVTTKPETKKLLSEHWRVNQRHIPGLI
ncbi:hypothetical protein NQ317_013298 [Molorchus minor]|uniref:Uncharacterized protein n=1 Tax=Molorchus minor TaxID=1323400 RepID=A0ABQ9JIF2_9CUCU|nr:hypothetical protein NQ317_013298 [Molorchus minor]